MLITKIRVFIKRKKVVSILILCLILLFVSCVGIVLTSVFKPPHGEDITPQNGVFALQYCPKNTLIGLERALFAHDFRAELLYYKISMTADTILVTLDGKLNEQSNAQSFFGGKNIRPCDYTYAQLRCLNMGENFENQGFPYRGLRGESIPEWLKILSVTELFEKCRAHTQLRFLFEIDCSGKALEQAMTRLDGLAAQYALYDRLYVVGTASAARLIDSEFSHLQRTAAPAETAALYLDYVFGHSKKALRYDALFLPSNNAFLNAAGEGLIKFAQSRRLEVFVLAKNTKEDISKQARRNADVIISSAPAITYDVISRG